MLSSETTAPVAWLSFAADRMSLCWSTLGDWVALHAWHDTLQAARAVHASSTTMPTTTSTTTTISQRQLASLDALIDDRFVCAILAAERGAAVTIDIGALPLDVLASVGRTQQPSLARSDLARRRWLVERLAFEATLDGAALTNANALACAALEPPLRAQLDATGAAMSLFAFDLLRNARVVAADRLAAQLDDSAPIDRLALLGSAAWRVVRRVSSATALAPLAARIADAALRCGNLRCAERVVRSHCFDAALDADAAVLLARIAHARGAHLDAIEQLAAATLGTQADDTRAAMRRVALAEWLQVCFCVTRVVALTHSTSSGCRCERSRSAVAHEARSVAHRAGARRCSHEERHCCGSIGCRRCIGTRCDYVDLL